MKRNSNIDAEQIEALITPRTKVIVPVHYAGVACDMDCIVEFADRHHLFVVEDAAQAIDSYYTGKPLGTIGHLSAFSFHETKTSSPVKATCWASTTSVSSVAPKSFERKALTKPSSSNAR